MPTQLRLTTTLLSCILCSAAAPAQQSAQNSSPQTAQTGAHRIALDVVVTPKSGKPVTGLQKQDFTLLDNNSPQPISSFEAINSTQTPAEVILLVDAVNTTFRNMSVERQQIDNFLKSNGGHLAQPITLAIFTDTGTEIQQSASTDGNQISATIDNSPSGLRQINRDSQYQGIDRLDLSLKTLQSLVARESTRPGRKIIFWVSPGWPILSGPGIELDGRQEQQIFSQVVAISTALRKNDIILYSIDPLGPGENVGAEFYYEGFVNGVKKPSQVQLGNLALQVLAIQSGGLALTSGNDIAAHLQRCMDDLAAYYRISYDAPPAEHPNEYHRIDVRVSTPGLIARTRTGYYSEP